MISHLLRLRLAISLIALFSFSSVYAEGYIGEDLGTDLYRTIDANYAKANGALASKRIVGANVRMNQAIKARCSLSKNFLSPGKEFTQDDLADLEAGQLAPLFDRIEPGTVLVSETVDCAKSVIVSDYQKIKNEVNREQTALSRISGIGIYTDGSLENSSFDLMKDLQDIHSIIFSQDIPYNGKVNTSSTSVGKFLASSKTQPLGFTGASLSTTLSSELSDAGWRVVNHSSGPWSRNPGSSDLGTFGPLCATGGSLTGVDASLINDISHQIAFGSNGGTTTGGPEDSGSGSGTGDLSSPSLALDGTAGGRNDQFGCTGFFCINVDFIMYNATLLGGSKTASIQSILEDNLKIVTKFAGSSFIQAKHTKNFFELLLKDLDLPGMAHIWVVVTSLPAPILNLPGDKTPRGMPTQSDDQKEFDELVSGVYGDYGLDPIRTNALPAIASNERDYGISIMSELNSDYAMQKFTPGRKFRTNYVALKEDSIKNGYYDSFTGDLVGFEAFTKGLVDHIGNFISLVQKIDEIPQG